MSKKNNQEEDARIRMYPRTPVNIRTQYLNRAKGGFYIIIFFPMSTHATTKFQKDDKDKWDKKDTNPEKKKADDEKKKM